MTMYLDLPAVLFLFHCEGMKKNIRFSYRNIKQLKGNFSSFFFYQLAKVCARIHCHTQPGSILCFMGFFISLFTPYPKEKSDKLI